MGFFKNLFSNNQNVANNSSNNSYYTVSNGIKIPMYLKELYDLSPRFAEQYVIYNPPIDTLYMLVNSLKSGREVENLAVYRYSEDRRLPYICDTEMEYNRLKDESEGVLGSLSENIEGILSIIGMYNYGEYLNPDKFNYWKSKLLSLAMNGNQIAQAALISTSGYASMAQFTNEERKVFEDRYKNELISNIENNNTDALIGFALFHNNGDLNKKSEYLLRAANKGSGEAYYHLAKNMQSLYYEYVRENNLDFDSTSKEYNEYREKELNYYRLGAMCYNGIHKGYCCHRLSDMYEDGEIVEKDINKAIFWCEKAIEAGHEYSKRNIKWLREKIINQE